MPTQQDIATHLDLSVRQIQNLLKSGVLPPSRGTGGYDPDACRVSYIRYLRGLSTKQVRPVSDRAGDDEWIDYERERARLTQAQADHETLKVAQLRRDLIPREVIVATWSSMVAAVRAKLLSFPTKAAHTLLACSTLLEVEDAAKAMVYESLAELSDTGLPSGYADADSAGDGDLGTAAGTDGEPVGRSKPPTKPRKQRGAGRLGHE